MPKNIQEGDKSLIPGEKITPFPFTIPHTTYEVIAEFGNQSQFDSVDKTVRYFADLGLAIVDTSHKNVFFGQTGEWTNGLFSIDSEGSVSIDIPLSYWNSAVGLEVVTPVLEESYIKRLDGIVGKKLPYVRNRDSAMRYLIELGMLFEIGVLDLLENGKRDPGDWGYFTVNENGVITFNHLPK